MKRLTNLATIISRRLVNLARYVEFSLSILVEKAKGAGQPEDVQPKLRTQTAVDTNEPTSIAAVPDRPGGNDDVRGFPHQPDNQPERTMPPDRRPEQAANPPNLWRRHGYAAIEVCKGAAQVIRWELEETRETTPEQLEDKSRLFRLGEWLSKQPISDQARAEYFDIERVSHTKNLF